MSVAGVWVRFRLNEREKLVSVEFQLHFCPSKSRITNGTDTYCPQMTEEAVYFACFPIYRIIQTIFV